MEYYYCKISIHAPTRGATGSIAGKLGGLDFNPRSHERSDSIATTIASKSFLISIHAPTRGATGQKCPLSYFFNFNPRSHERSDAISCHFPLYITYFNPRSHERSDILGSGFVLSGIDFNPRSHERSDGRMCLYLQLNRMISIHAPTRGATRHKII